MENTEQINSKELRASSGSKSQERKMSFSKEVMASILAAICLYCAVVLWRSEALVYKEAIIAGAIIGMALILKVLQRD